MSCKGFKPRIDTITGMLLGSEFKYRKGCLCAGAAGFAAMAAFPVCALQSQRALAVSRPCIAAGIAALSAVYAGVVFLVSFTVGTGFGPMLTNIHRHCRF